MANTLTNTRTFAGKRRVVQYLTLASDGSEESATVVYDSSVVATALGVSDPLNCTLKRIRYSVNGATALVHILWNATTNVVAFSLPYGGGGGVLDMDFKEIGGLHNAAGSGKTGDILITTTGLNAGDSITLILEVDPETND